MPALVAVGAGDHQPRKRRRAEDAEDDRAAAQAPVVRAEANQVAAPIHVQTISKNTASPPRTHYPLVGPKASLFPERLPKPWTPGDWATEYTMCSIFDRPPRNDLTSTPFYPWMPRQTPKFSVSFKLGFKP